jgi:hypothetical protein
MEYFNTLYLGDVILRNIPITITNAAIARIIAKPNINTFRFINKMSASGTGVASLKYLIVESKITLLIAALNPLNKKRKIIRSAGTESIFINHHRFVFSD